MKNDIQLADGTKLFVPTPQEKVEAEKELQEVLDKHNVVLVPVLLKEISSLTAGINLYKKSVPSSFNGENTETTEESNETTSD